MKTLIFANTKGGVCKTHLAYHAAMFLTRNGKKVLCLDLDQQSHLVKLLRANGSRTLFEVVTSGQHDRITECIYQRGNLYCVYSESDLRNLDMYLTMTDSGRETLLHRILKPYYKNFDYCIVDMPPSSNLTTTNAYAFPDVHVIAPVTLNHLSLLGLKYLEDFISTYNENMEKDVRFHKIVICRDNIEISQHAHDTRQWLEENYNGSLSKANFPHSIHYVNSAANGLSIEEYFERNNHRKSETLIESLNVLFNEILL